MKRKANTLLPLEIQILQLLVGHAEQREGLHGYEITKLLEADRLLQRGLIGHGTLYKALNRLAERGAVTRQWERQIETKGSRPRRRYYKISVAGARLLATALDDGDAVARTSSLALGFSGD